MSPINWGLVSDGGAFESLVHCLVFANDPGATLFGRPGRDSGQDALSSDRQTVYQAKYRQALDMNGAIRIARRELEKITEYLKPEHKNYIHWQNPTRWVLVANLRINPNDADLWQRKIVPAFRKHRLDAVCWSLERLEQELISHPEIQSVFFEGENRVLVGLKEAYDLLEKEMVGAESLEKPLVDRQAEIGVIREFLASQEKQILPIIGSGGMGKSRLAFQAISELADDGWRGFWGLSGSMSQSSSWFRLLNGNQKTIIVLDNPESAGLVRTVIEQLGTTERRNWKVVLLCRPENQRVFQRYLTNNAFHDPVKLQPLGENETHELVKSVLDCVPDADWLHRVYNFTQGVPGWLCLIAELANKGRLHAVPENAAQIASAYINSCLDALDESKRSSAKTLLRWVSLLGSLCLPTDGETSPELQHLETQGVSATETRDLLNELAHAGIISNWGFRKSVYAVEPVIIRQQILAEWLLQDSGGEVKVSIEGNDLIQKLAEGAIPSDDAALKTLNQLVCVRLGSHDSIAFLRPLFQMLTDAAKTTGSDLFFLFSARPF